MYPNIPGDPSRVIETESVVLTHFILIQQILHNKPFSDLTIVY